MGVLEGFGPCTTPGCGAHNVLKTRAKEGAQRGGRRILLDWDVVHVSYPVSLASYVVTF